MPLLLNIETSAQLCSVCLSKGEKVLALAESNEKFVHAAKITQFIESCAREAQVTLRELDAVVLSKGPGSYTGLRVGSSAAKGICYALDKPLIAIHTLQQIAHATHQKLGLKARYCPMIDARRMEVYSAQYNAYNEELVPTEAIIITADSFAEQLASMEEKLVISGDGAEKCKALLTDSQIVFDDTSCSSRHLVPLGLKAYAEKQFEDLAYFSPFYFKAPNITMSKKRI
ncbi:MAG: tRNA (adenosine(37)-N6)-threonylcarbamoyltransferase complex dimerization subunit type 1 TsaB [Saprospiraceae bacterium]